MGNGKKDNPGGAESPELYARQLMELEKDRLIRNTSFQLHHAAIAYRLRLRELPGELFLLSTIAIRELSKLLAAHNDHISHLEAKIDQSRFFRLRRRW